MRTRTKFVLAASLLFVLVLGSVGIAATQADTPPLPQKERGTPAQRGARVYGVVETVVGDSLTLAAPVGSVLVITNANARFRIPGVEDPGLSDLDVGDHYGRNRLVGERWRHIPCLWRGTV
ncbi:MAG: hypothetical protein V3S14_05030 [Anaerolineae bacterium]